MPIFNLVRNCSYYWGFAAFMSYFINHPQYTPVGETQMYIGFAISTIFQLANLKCHLILAALRGDGRARPGGADCVGLCHSRISSVR